MTTGRVFTNKGFKPFEQFREIKRGKNRGRIEVHVRKIYNSRINWRPIIVDKDQIRIFPS